MQSRSLFIYSISFLLVSIAILAQTKITPRLMSQLYDEEVKVKAWVYFKDKGPDANAALNNAEEYLAQRALERRNKTRQPIKIDTYDLPVYAGYVRQVKPHVIQLRKRSRWLNAVSVEATQAQLYSLERLDCVERIDLVFTAKVPVDPIVDAKTPAISSQFHKTTRLDYGASLSQNSMMNVPELHDQGLTGQGVLIAVLDAGFNNLGHQALDHLDIVATYDFVNGDVVVSDQPGQMGIGNHGTYVLSSLGGFHEGELIGPAYGASYVLAKTENTNWERHVEEDAWVAAAEWADSLGADIISSSVGYLDFFTDGDFDYSWMDMDGNTTVVTRGADIAASRGILVVNSAGNEGVPVAGRGNTLIGPADGDSVLAVGAVSADGVIAGFSSRGPTVDGRIKPDVMAMGVNVYLASIIDNRYLNSSGTSFSCPLTSGVAALLMEAEPERSTMEIIAALRGTAGNAASPNNELGWGIVNGLSALSLLRGELGAETSQPVLQPNAPNPFDEFTRFSYQIPQDGNVRLEIYDVLGRKVTTIVDAYQLASVPLHVATWNSQEYIQGVYFAVLRVGNTESCRKILLVR